MAKSALDMLGEALENVGDKIENALADGTMKAAVYASGELKSEVRREFPEGRTGALSKSFAPEPMRMGDKTVGAQAVSRLEYARIQDEGGTIRAKTRRNLAIPLPGVRLPVGKWPRDFGKDELRLLLPPGKSPILAKVIGQRKVLARRGGRTVSKMEYGYEPLFVLKPSVTLRGRGYIDSTHRRIADDLVEMVGGMAVTATERGLDGDT